MIRILLLIQILCFLCFRSTAQQAQKEIPISLIVDKEVLSPEFLKIYFVDKNSNTILNTQIINKNGIHYFQIYESPKAIKISVLIKVGSLGYSAGEWAFDSLLNCEKIEIKVKKMLFPNDTHINFKYGKEHILAFADFYSKSNETLWRTDYISSSKKYFHKKIRKALSKAEVYSSLNEL